MKQHNQIGKYTKKQDIFEAKKNRTFVTPNNREYQLDYEKIGNKYIIIIIYKGKRMQIKEQDYNCMPIDGLLIAIEKTL